MNMNADREKQKNKVEGDIVMLIDDYEVSGITALNIIRRGGQLTKMIKEIIIDKEVEHIELGPEKESELLNNFRKNEGLESEEEYRDFMKSRILDEYLLTQMICRPSKIVAYREERWGPRANSLYLKYKDRFELVTYNCLGSTDTNVMQEVYFRLKDGEETWEEMGKQFNASYLHGPIPIEKVDNTLIEQLRANTLKKICHPFKCGNKWVVSQLISFENKVYDDELRSQILREEFDSWLKEELQRSLKKVTIPT